MDIWEYETSQRKEKEEGRRKGLGERKGKDCTL